MTLNVFFKFGRGHFTPLWRDAKKKSNPILASGKASIMLGVVDDFRTFDWTEMIPHPEMVYQKSVQFLQAA